MTVRYDAGGRRRSAWWRAAIVLLVAGSSSACSTLFKRSSPDPVLLPGEARVDSAAYDDAVRARFRGELPLGLDYYQNRGAEFYTRVRGQGWHGFRRQRRCAHDAACAGVARGFMVVQAIEDAHKVPVALDPAIRAVVIGRVMNVGMYDDSILPVPRPSGSYPDQYYFVIQPGTAERAVLRIARVRFGPTGSPLPHLDIVNAPNGYVRCNHSPDPSRTVGLADFISCDDAGSIHHGASPPPGLQWASSASPPIIDTSLAMAWFSCVDGCCSAQWPP
jgi:hypothetical protein